MKIILKISIISIILCTLITIPTFAKTGKVVNTDEVRFRAKASATEDSEVLGKVPRDTTVEILEEIVGWYKVEYNGKVGYINSAYLEKIDDSKNQTTTENQNNNAEPTTENQNNNAEPTIENPNNNTEPTIENTVVSGNSENSTQVTYKIVDKAQVRLMPLINSNIISSLDKGINCTVITKAGKWSYVETATIKGWVLSAKLESTTSQNSDNNSNGNTTQDVQTKKGYVNLNTINVRKGPSTATELVTTLTLNTEVTILGEDGDWYLVELNGEKVYIFKELLSDSKVTLTSRSSDFNRTEATNTVASVPVLGENPVTASSINATIDPSVNADVAPNENSTVANANSTTLAKGNEVVAYAKQYLGYPYVYATSGPDSFDCSGFTSYVYRHFGYNISRSSSAQQYEGTEVSKENLQPGDIIIFLNTAKTAVGHVGIYIGDNQFIHASSSTTGVIISSLSSANYPQRYVTARRILK